MSKSTAKDGELGLVRILPRHAIRPSPENDKLYRPIVETDPEIIALAGSIREHGVKEPLVITADNYILSGHRRFVASGIAGLKELPCRVDSVFHDSEKFMVLLREYNRQREKSRDEKLREAVVSANPEEAHRRLVEHRRKASRVKDGDFMEITGDKVRAEISDAKAPFLDAIMRVLKEREDFLPLSDRQIHYALLNAPPLIHASKPGSTYRNDKSSYKALTDLLTRARLEGFIPMEWIADPTRPVVTWKVHREVSAFMAKCLDDLLKGYYRDYMQSQSNQIEIVGEKNTIESVIRPVAMEFTIPYTIGRGYCSLRPRHDLAERFKASGKEKLILLILSDFDPDGEEIAQSFVRSLRDDFGIADIEAKKVALTAEQIEEHSLPRSMEAKESSSNYQKFFENHGDAVFELEALRPEDLQAALRLAIESVIDRKALNHEIDQEKEDAAFLENKRREILAMLGRNGQ